MTEARIDRRAVLLGTGATLLAVGARGTCLPRAYAAPLYDKSTRFVPTYVQSLAQQLAAQPFAAPTIALPPQFQNVGYDRYRDIRFRSDQAIWRGERTEFELQLFPIGWLFNVPVEIWIVNGDKAERIKPEKDLFTFGPLFGDVPEGAPFGFSGFRVHGPLNRSDYFDEYLVFQGASYFRAVGRGQVYGMSARGLAINTARPGGEEFPIFRAFWIEKPQPGAHSLTIHALLDSVSTTGAFKFSVEPGESTNIDVEAKLYPRRTLTHVGLGPLTSMYLTGPGQHRVDDDFRPAVHDSDGLAIFNGASECIWRPLTNPRTLQTSAFMDTSPKGFGLCQRARDFRDYEDLEARYERRPTVWVEPKGPWGQGYVELIEIPTTEEIHDNIVAYWKPAHPPEPGSVFSYAYRMHWTDDVPLAWAGARAASTRVGRGKKPGTTLFVVDFTGPAVPGDTLPVAAVTANPGRISDVTVHANPEIDGVRVSFELDPAGTEVCELRLLLKRADQQISETWLYRWTKA